MALDLETLAFAKSYIKQSLLGDGARGATPEQAKQIQKNKDAIERIQNELQDYAKTENIPTKISELNNDSGFITEEDISEMLKELTYDETMDILNEEPTGEGGE